MNWICSECGDKHGCRVVSESTWHLDWCDWCGKCKPVTDSRDYACFNPPYRRRA